MLDVFQETCDNCIKYAYLYTKKSSYYSRTNTALNMYNILATSIVAGSVKNPDTEAMLNTLLIISGIINSIQQVYNFEKLSESYRLAGTNFLALSNKIKRVIDDNSDLNKKIEILKEYDNLVETSPSLPEFLIDSKKLKSR